MEGVRVGGGEGDLTSLVGRGGKSFHRLENSKSKDTCEKKSIFYSGEWKSTGSSQLIK